MVYNIVTHLYLPVEEPTCYPYNWAHIVDFHSKFAPNMKMKKKIVSYINSKYVGYFVSYESFMKYTVWFGLWFFFFSNSTPRTQLRTNTAIAYQYNIVLRVPVITIRQYLTLAGW